MRWIGLHDGYVSADGRFLVTQITVSGRRGPVTKWALHGLVLVEGALWRWSAEPIFGPVATKRECQSHALASDYVPPVLAAPMSRPPPGQVDKPIGYEVCQECGVHYQRPAKWIYDDYCGPNCFEIVEERVTEIRARLDRRAR